MECPLYEVTENIYDNKDVKNLLVLLTALKGVLST